MTLKKSIFKPKADCQIINLSSVYENLFGSLADGIFLEIGAFDGETVSNTCFLADLGWKGYYCEPIAEYALKCQFRHVNNNIRVLPCAVGDKSKMIDISVGAMITSARMDHVELFNNMNWSKGHHRGDLRRVPCVEINQLILALNLTKCNLVVVDVEGYEPAILSNWNFSLLRPDVLIIESRDRDNQFPEHIKKEYKDMLYLLKNNGYHEIQHDGCNVILSCSDKAKQNSDSLLVF
jgi:FkbM family methyltransferase